MPSDLTRWLASTPAEREQERALDQIRNEVERSFYKQAGIGASTRAGIREAVLTALEVQAAELTVPGSGVTAVGIALAGTGALRSEINNLQWRLSRL